MRSARSCSVLIITAVLAPSILAARPSVARAQTAPLAVEYFVGSEFENYLRMLQVAGELRSYPWSLRAFAPKEVWRLLPTHTAHPWTSHPIFRGRERRAFAQVMRPAMQVRYNSAFPYGSNERGVWNGRGFTTAVEFGFAARLGPVSMSVRPLAFLAENEDFRLAPNGKPHRFRFSNQFDAGAVDRPQRFGSAMYSRIEPGETSVRVDLPGVAAGFSTASDWWGPMQRYPFVLGNNAAGFPHLFASTTNPVNLFLGRLHGRAFWGRLEQSDYFEPTRPTSASRFATGLVVVANVAGLPGLEVGAGRFFHAPWPADGLPNRYLMRAFESILKKGLPQDTARHRDPSSIDGENQVASAFARWVFPNTGVEVYGEFGREDHSWDLRDLLLYPEKAGSRAFGIQATWGPTLTTRRRVRGETINFLRPSASTRGEIQGSAIYKHSSGSFAGHTNRGMLLGADIGTPAAAASMLAFDMYSAKGRWTVTASRTVRGAVEARGPLGTRNPRGWDVLQTLGAERLLFRGGTDLLIGIDAGLNLNRDFVGDRTNVSIYGRVTPALPRG